MSNYFDTCVGHFILTNENDRLSKLQFGYL